MKQFIEKGGNRMIQYYAVIKQNKIEYWKGDHTKRGFLIHTAGLILPLGTRKPKNVSRETIRQF